MTTRPKLAVILGAGASHDVCPYKGPIKDLRWKPPIVKTMFDGSALDEVLARHPEAAALMSSVRTDVRAGLTFEQSLRAHLSNPNPYVQRQMAFVPIALHEFFYLVSTNFTNEAVNYSHLVNRTIGQGIHTAYITVNYDTLLDTSLSKVTGVAFDSVESYVSSTDWILVKLHGSVGWGYPWDTAEDSGLTLTEDSLSLLWPAVLTGAIDMYRPPLSLGVLSRVKALSYPLPAKNPDVIDVGPDPGTFFHQGGSGGGDVCYPALALPVTGKYGFVCPPSHLEALKAFLADCENFLFIGFSANDQDLLDLLKDTVQNVKSFCVVAGPPPDQAEGAASRLLQAVPRFRVPYPPGTGHFGYGFTVYLEHKEGLDRLVSLLVH